MKAAVDVRLFELFQQRNNGDDEVGDTDSDKNLFSLAHIHHLLSGERKADNRLS